MTMDGDKHGIQHQYNNVAELANNTNCKKFLEIYES